MNKIILFLIISILLLSGHEAVANTDDEKHIENQVLIMDDWALELKFNGGLLGYQLTIENVGNVTIEGKLTMNITTNAWFITRGQNLEFPLCPLQLNLSPGEKVSFNPGPVIGFGPATIKITGKFTYEETKNQYPFETNGNGFLFLILNNIDVIPVNLP